mmetsp:Transcript_22912/g.56947  ORF Transcript_22912/g.56947 Transcript_22912/m.56947 type:complete len:114 (-) Transcript_22912:953-1294(-)
METPAGSSPEPKRARIASSNDNGTLKELPDEAIHRIFDFVSKRSGFYYKTERATVSRISRKFWTYFHETYVTQFCELDLADASNFLAHYPSLKTLKGFFIKRISRMNSSCTKG